MKRDALQKILLELLKIPSPSKSERMVAEYIRESFSELGLKTEIDTIGNVILEHDGVCESHSFYYISHIDTVRPFFKPKVVDDFIVGRGAVDAKGPLIAMIDALHESKNPCIKVYGLVGEEDDSRGAFYLVQTTKNLQNVIIGEPSNNSICVGYRGRLLLEFKCKGSRRHTASTEKKNPIHEITEIIILLEQAIDSIGGGRIIGTPTTIISKSLSNVVPHSASLTYDIRFADEKSISILLERVQASLKEGCIYRKRIYIPPVEVKPSNILVNALARTIAKEGLTVRYIKKMGTSDMNVLFKISEHIVSFGPGDPKLSHTLKERININDIITASKVLQRLPFVYNEIVKSKNLH